MSSSESLSNEEFSCLKSALALITVKKWIDKGDPMSTAPTTAASTHEPDTTRVSTDIQSNQQSLQSHISYLMDLYHKGNSQQRNTLAAHLAKLFSQLPKESGGQWIQSLFHSKHVTEVCGALKHVIQYEHAGTMVADAALIAVVDLLNGDTLTDDDEGSWLGISDILDTLLLKYPQAWDYCAEKLAEILFTDHVCLFRRTRSNMLALMQLELHRCLQHHRSGGTQWNESASLPQVETQQTAATDNSSIPGVLIMPSTRH